uniref:WRKY transcription factor n=1 Tax=Fagopyrum tataricum TaxID=62330 RepID=A0A4P9Q280_FAGTA|nr:WRKY transcription factor [Fagopyrum tataricum]
MGPVSPHIFSLQRPNPSNPWELRSSGSECLVSKRSFNGDSEPSLEDHDSVNATNDNMIDKKSLLGVSALRMKKMKGRRKVREPRFCFKTLSDVDVLDDGYKWRKYGQKVVKNTQHPRSYYRCTQDKCRVKKRVERLAEDPRMVITTYEGRHVHSPSHDNPDEDSNNGLPTLNNFFW